MWLGWAATMLVVFAVMTGIFHSYYTIMIAPATAVLAGVGGAGVVQHQGLPTAKTILVWAAALTGVLAFVLLTLTPGWLPLLRWGVLGATVVLAVLASRITMTPQQRWHWVLAAGLVAVISPTAYSVATVAAQHAGDSPVVGPRHSNSPGEVVPASDPGFSPSWLLTRLEEQPAVVVDAMSLQVAGLLRSGADGYRWAAATGGSRAAADLELSSGAPVIAIGGYKGTDPAPSLSGFVSLVAAGEVHYFLDGWTAGPSLSKIQDWVAAHYQHETVDGIAVYDLTSPIGM